MGARGPSSVIDRLVIIGVGLIGGSLARALRRSDAVGEIVGVGRSAANLEAAVELGVVDRFEFDAAEAVKGADMVVVAVTLGASAAILETIGPAPDENTFVPDVGSTKLSVVASARAALGARFPNFVPGHPIAGTERSGVKASFAELFEDHKVILTPVSETREEALHAVVSLWRARARRWLRWRPLITIRCSRRHRICRICSPTRWSICLPPRKIPFLWTTTMEMIVFL